MLGKCFVCLVSFLFQFSCLQRWRFTKSYLQDAAILGIVFNLYENYSAFLTRVIFYKLNIKDRSTSVLDANFQFLIIFLGVTWTSQLSAGSLSSPTRGHVSSPHPSLVIYILLIRVGQREKEGYVISGWSTCIIFCQCNIS